MSESVEFIVLLDLTQSWILVLVGGDRQTSTDLYVSYYRLLGKNLGLLGVLVNSYRLLGKDLGLLGVRVNTYRLLLWNQSWLGLVL